VGRSWNRILNSVSAHIPEGYVQSLADDIMQHHQMSTLVCYLTISLPPLCLILSHKIKSPNYIFMRLQAKDKVSIR